MARGGHTYTKAGALFAEKWQPAWSQVRGGGTSNRGGKPCGAGVGVGVLLETGESELNAVVGEGGVSGITPDRSGGEESE